MWHCSDLGEVHSIYGQESRKQFLSCCSDSPPLSIHFTSQLGHLADKIIDCSIVSIFYLFCMVNQHSSAILHFSWPNYEYSKTAEWKKSVFLCSCPTPPTYLLYNFCKLQPQSIEVCHSAVSLHSQSNPYGIHSLQASREAHLTTSILGEMRHRAMASETEKLDGWLRCPYILLKEFLLDSVEFIEWTVSALVKTSNCTWCQDIGSREWRHKMDEANLLNGTAKLPKTVHCWNWCFIFVSVLTKYNKISVTEQLYFGIERPDITPIVCNVVQGHSGKEV